MNIENIRAELATLSFETLEFIGFDANGNRQRTSAILHPNQTDQAVWAKVLELAGIIPNLKASTLADVTGLDRVAVSKALKYFVESGLMSSTGAKSATTYALVDGANNDSQLPTVEAKPRGRRAAHTEETPEETAEVEDKPKAPKRRTSKKKTKKAA